MLLSQRHPSLLNHRKTARQVATHSSKRTCNAVPWAAFTPQPLRATLPSDQPSCARKCAAVQIAAFPPSPLQYGQQVTACSSLRICSHIPWAALLHFSTTSIQPSDTSSRPQHIHEHGSYGFVVVQMFKFDGNSLVSVRELGYHLTHCKALTLPIDADILQMLDLKRVENKTVAYSRSMFSTDGRLTRCPAAYLLRLFFDTSWWKISWLKDKI